MDNLTLEPHCAHGKLVYEHCDECLKLAHAGVGHGFIAPLSSKTLNTAQAVRLIRSNAETARILNEPFASVSRDVAVFVADEIERLQLNVKMRPAPTADCECGTCFAIRQLQKGTAVDTAPQSSKQRWKLTDERVGELRKEVDKLLSTLNMYECVAMRDMLSDALTAHEGAVTDASISECFRDLLKSARNALRDAGPVTRELVARKIDDALASASSETPAAQCTRSHPHEEMNVECERLTEIARSNALRTEERPDAWMSSINPRLVTANQEEAMCWHNPPIRLYRRAEKTAAPLTHCPYCHRPSDAQGGILHVGGCAGLEDVVLSRLQYDLLVARGTAEKTAVTPEQKAQGMREFIQANWEREKTAVTLAACSACHAENTIGHLLASGKCTACELL